MGNHAGTVGIIAGIGVDSRNIDSGPYSICGNILKRLLFGRLLFFVKTIVEYAFGMHMGFAIGWLTGWGVGHTYVKYFKPVYIDDLSQLFCWRLMPYDFARIGAAVGVVVGVIAISLINSRLLSRRVASLYEKDVTEPEDIARALGESERQIRRIVNKLAKKQKNRKETYSQKDYQAQGPIPLGPVIDMYEVLYKLKKIS